MDQPIARRELHARLPLFGAHLVADRAKVGTVVGQFVHGRCKNIAMRILMAALFALAATLAHAQAYPSKPVRLIIPFPPGGSNDLVGRAVAAQLGERLGQSVVIDNRGGGGGTIGINAAAKSPADGYTLLLVSVGWPVRLAVNRMPGGTLQR